MNCVRSQLDNGKNVLGLYLDLKKAFGTVDHSILLEKLLHYGIRGKAHSIISSYLKNRKQCVYVNNTFSSYSEVSTGVPQGSVLGPLLFLIYINDISNAVPNTSARLFADDTNIFLSDRNCTGLIQKGVHTLSKLHDWFDSNKLTLHLGKTTYSIFHSSTKAHSCCNSFAFKDSIINKSSSTKYLGLIIDDKLSWVDHTNDLCNFLTKYTGIFYQLKDLLPQKTALHMYYAFVFSKLRYAVEIYGTAKSSVLMPLQVLQNKLLKLLTGKTRYYPTKQLYHEYELFMLNDIHFYCMCQIIYKYCNDMIPYAISTAIFPERNLILNRPMAVSTRNRDLFAVSHHNTPNAWQIFVE